MACVAIARCAWRREGLCEAGDGPTPTSFRPARNYCRVGPTLFAAFSTRATTACGFET